MGKRDITDVTLQRRCRNVIVGFEDMGGDEV
jgi:hypothetical protein